MERCLACEADRGRHPAFYVRTASSVDRKWVGAKMNLVTTVLT